ncbi:MAG: glycosyltransferase family 9 protein [Gillisia sp.]
MTAARSHIPLPPEKGEIPQGKAAHLLVIRLSAMGDVAMTFPVLKVLTETYPQLKITVLTRSFFKPLFNLLNNIEVYEADIKGVHSGVIGLSRLAKELRDLEIDAVADLHDVLRSNILKSVFYFYGIPVQQINKGRAEKKALTSLKNKVFQPLKSTHERYAEVFLNLDYPIDLNSYVPVSKLPIPEEIKNSTANDRLKWIGVAPFAQHPSKVYPLELMKTVLEKLSKKHRIFLFGGGKEESDALEDFAANFENTSSVAGKLSFKKELALISNLDAMLSMDSGNAHLAAIFGIPVVTLWGVTHPFAGFRAFNQPMENCLLPDLEKYPLIPTSVYGNKFPSGYEKVMETIAPEQVSQKVLEVMKVPRRKS